MKADSTLTLQYNQIVSTNTRQGFQERKQEKTPKSTATTPHSGEREVQHFNWYGDSKSNKNQSKATGSMMDYHKKNLLRKKSNNTKN